MYPYFDPNEKPPEPDLDPTGRKALEPDLHYVSASEATPEDKMTFSDRMAVMAGVGCAQFLRLLIVVAAIAILFVVVYLVTHL